MEIFLVDELECGKVLIELPAKKFIEHHTNFKEKTMFSFG